MKMVYLIRRGLPDFPGGKGMGIGTTDIPMGERGLAQAAMAEAARIRPADFAVVAHGGIIARFLQQITGIWYKPGYTEVPTLFWNDGPYFTKESVSP